MRSRHLLTERREVNAMIGRSEMTGMTEATVGTVGTVMIAATGIAVVIETSGMITVTVMTSHPLAAAEVGR